MKATDVVTFVAEKPFSESLFAETSVSGRPVLETLAEGNFGVERDASGRNV